MTSKSNRSATNQTFNQAERQSRVHFENFEMKYFEQHQENEKLRIPQDANAPGSQPNRSYEESKTESSAIQDQSMISKEENHGQTKDVEEKSQCAICQKVTMFLCPCQRYAYCSEEHQLQHWQEHYKDHEEPQQQTQSKQPSKRNSKTGTQEGKQSDKRNKQNQDAKSPTDSSEGHPSLSERLDEQDMHQQINKRNKGKGHKRQASLSRKVFANEDDNVHQNDDLKDSSEDDNQDHQFKNTFARGNNEDSELEQHKKNKPRNTNQDSARNDLLTDKTSFLGLRKLQTMGMPLHAPGDKSQSSNPDQAQLPMQLNPQNNLYVINLRQSDESKWIQALILIAKQDYNSAIYNAEEMFKDKKQVLPFITLNLTLGRFKVIQGKAELIVEANQMPEVTILHIQKKKYTQQYAMDCSQLNANQQVKNLILVQCQQYIESDIKSVEIILGDCEHYLNLIKPKISEMKKEIMDIKKRKQEQKAGPNDDRVSRMPGGRATNKAPTFIYFKWMLSAFATIAAFYNAIGNRVKCEIVYVKYVKWIEQFYGQQSLEASNSYFLVGVYYFENDALQKSLACFIKSLYIRTKELGEVHPSCADCYVNMGILYKKLQVPIKALTCLEKALQIKRECIGHQSLPVAKILEELGKYYLEKLNYQKSYQAFQECYEIRKKILRKQNHEDVQKISCLLLYLHKNIEKELQERLSSENKKGAKLANLGGKIKNHFLEQIEDNFDEEEMIKGNSLASKVMRELFQKRQEENKITKGRPKNDEDEQKESQWHDEEFEKAIQNFVKIAGSKIQEETASNDVEKKQQQQKRPLKMFGSNRSGNQHEEDDVEKFINRGFDQFFNIVKTQLYEKVAPYIIAFLLSLNQQQIIYLQKCQLSKDGFAPLYFPNEFKDNMHPFQLNLYSKSQIWKIPRSKYLKGEFSLSNLYLPEYNKKSVYRQQVQRDQKFMRLIQEIPQFLKTLNDLQKRIFQNAIQHEVLLKYFFVTVSVEQMQDFENFIQDQNKDQEYEDILRDLAQQMPFTLKASKLFQNDPLVKILDYKQEMCQIIDNIRIVDVFRSIDVDLPDNYISNLQLNQIQRLMKLKNELQSGMPDIKEIQVTLKRFITDLDIKEAYEFSILNPFLINEEELETIINEINQEELGHGDYNTTPQNNMKLDLNNFVNSSDESDDSQSEENMTSKSQTQSKDNYRTQQSNNVINQRTLQQLRAVSNQSQQRGKGRKSLMTMDLDKFAVDASSRGDNSHFSFNNADGEKMSNGNYKNQLNIIKEDNASFNSDSEDDDKVRQNFQMLGLNYYNK